MKEKISSSWVSKENRLAAAVANSHTYQQALNSFTFHFCGLTPLKNKWLFLGMNKKIYPLKKLS